MVCAAFQLLREHNMAQPECETVAPTPQPRRTKTAPNGVERTKDRRRPYTAVHVPCNQPCQPVHQRRFISSSPTPSFHHTIHHFAIASKPSQRAVNPEVLESHTKTATGSPVHPIQIGLDVGHPHTVHPNYDIKANQHWTTVEPLNTTTSGHSSSSHCTLSQKLLQIWMTHAIG